jgi:hypothetical protein
MAAVRTPSLVVPRRPLLAISSVNCPSEVLPPLRACFFVDGNEHVTGAMLSDLTEPRHSSSSHSGCTYPLLSFDARSLSPLLLATPAYRQRRHSISASCQAASLFRGDVVVDRHSGFYIVIVADKVPFHTFSSVHSVFLFDSNITLRYDIRVHYISLLRDLSF